jgi:hypothetical protein
LEIEELFGKDHPSSFNKEALKKSVRWGEAIYRALCIFGYCDPSHTSISCLLQLVDAIERDGERRYKYVSNEVCSLGIALIDAICDVPRIGPHRIFQ